ATSASVCGTMCYERLVDLTFDLAEIRPALATEWEQLDETTFNFTLREGVEFHNGEQFTAEDVAFSIERMRGTTNDATVSWIDNVEVLGDFEVEITGAEPHAPFLNDLSAVPILPSGVDGISENPQEDSFAFDSQSVGTGPFILDNFEPEDRVELVRNEDYWWEGEEMPGMAPWETVTFRVVPEQVSQQEAILAGELDMIDNPAPFELDIFDGEDPEVVSTPAVGFDFVSFPVNAEPFTNAKFRRGMARLVPTGDIIEAIFGGNATELAGPISPGLGTFWDPEHEQELLDEWVGQNEEEGLRLIEEGLQEQGIEPPVEIDFITNVNRTRERWMEVIQNRMNETEFINANLDIQEFSQLVPFLLDPEGAAQSSSVVGIGWTGGSDPDGHVAQLIHSRNHVPDGFNWNLYENEEADTLVDQGKTETDVDERVEIYNDLQELLVEESPSAWMWTGDRIHIVLPDNVTNWQAYPNSSLKYWALYRPTVGQVAWDPEE
ncbi:MAG: ABC transporter substrate-binding protein, partial [Halovenus sp.]